MRTDPSKAYRIRKKDSGRWLAERRSSIQRYWKLWEPNSCQFDGGKKLDELLKKRPDVEAVEVKKKGNRERY